MNNLKQTDRRIISTLASLYALRMLGLFLIYPILAIYGAQLLHATPFLVGLAMGAYGLTQACLQIPFGVLSDHFGRKRLILIGLFLFALGSVVAALSSDIYGLIAGRFLQGAGAVSAVITALLADLLAPEKRAKAMAVIGFVIGMTFGLSLVLGPALGSFLGLNGLFALIALLSVGAMFVLKWLVPEPAALDKPGRLSSAHLKQVLKNAQLWRLNISIFSLHTTLTALFLIIPMQLFNLTSGWQQQSGLYLLLLVLSYALMMPILTRAERSYRQKPVLLAAVLALAFVFIYLAFMPDNLWALVLGLLLFLIPFNLLEATLPAWASRIAKPQAKGAALGVYSTAQFLGIFVGGTLSGTMLQSFSTSAVFFSCALLMLIWFIIACGLKPLSVSMELQQNT